MNHLRIKICGVTTRADARLAAEAGADAVGLNFYPRSPRYVDPRRAPELLRALPPLVQPVGVFVEQPLRQVCAVAYQLGLRAVQWVGERPEVADPAPFALIPAFRVGGPDDLTAITAYLEACRQGGFPVGAVLVDARVEGAYGGMGRGAQGGRVEGEETDEHVEEKTEPGPVAYRGSRGCCDRRKPRTEEAGFWRQGGLRCR